MRSTTFRSRLRCGLLVATASAHLLPAWPQSSTVQQRPYPVQSANSAAAAEAGQLASQPTVTSDTYHIHGVVVDSHTGKPISRALVEAYGDRLATLTDHDGRFALELRFTLPKAGADEIRGAMLSRQMTFPVSARKPGYVGRFPQQQTQVQVSALDQDIVLKLTPESVIQGRVAAAGDDYPENVRISLLARRVQDGSPRWVQTSMATTNSRGEYRFGDLQPGEYRLMTQEWSDRPGQAAEFNAPASRFAPLFYPAGSAGTSGPNLHVDAGEVVPVNLNLRPETFYPVHVPVALPAGGAGVQTRVLRAGSAGLVSGFTLRYNTRDKVVEGLLPNGAYEIVLQSSGRDPSAATASLAVNGSAVETAPITLLPLPSIPVIVHQDLTQSKTASPDAGMVMGSVMGSIGGQGLPVQVMLMSEEMNGPSTMLNQMPNQGNADPDHLALEHVLPGTYRVEIWGRQGYVASATSGGTDLLRQPLVVSPSGGVAPIEITLRDDSATVHGTIDPAATGSSPPPILFVLCVPSQPSTQRLLQTVAPVGGKFTLGNLAPGTYRIFASSQSFDTIEYRSEGFLQRYGSKGYAVTLEPGSSTTVTLTSVLEEAP